MNQFEKQSLDAHNKYRSSHHATPFTWNASLAREAHAWAERLANEDRLKHASTDDGENIYMSFGDVDVTGDVAVDKWYQEVKEYSFSRPGFQSNTGHFTQIVWRGSKELGVGKAQGYDGKVFVVARYRPPGNNLRTFEENVLPAQKHIPLSNSGGWNHSDLNGEETSTNLNHSKRNSAYRDYSEAMLNNQDWRIRSPDRWDPVYVGSKDSPKRGSDGSYRKSYGQQDSTRRSRSTDHQRESKKDDKDAGTRQHSANSYSGGCGQSKFTDHKWDSGRWFDEDAVQTSVNTTQHSSPESKILENSSSLKEKDKKEKTKGVSTRWQPEGNRDQVKEPKKDKLRIRKGGRGSKGYYRDSVDRNKSCNKVRASTEKWESIGNNGELEPDGGESKVGRSRTQQSIKRWEEQTFNQPNPSRQPFRSSMSSGSTIQPSQSKQVYAERWDPLWGDKPLDESRRRPVSWDSSKFGEDKVDNYHSRPYDEPRERKITTTILEGPKKTVVSSLTIILKGNEDYLGDTRSKSSEDLIRPKNSYSRTNRSPLQEEEVFAEAQASRSNTRPRSEDLSSCRFDEWVRRPIEEVFADERASRTNTRPKSEDLSSRRFNECDTRRPVEEGLIVAETKRISDTTDGYHGCRDTKPRKTFPSLDHFSQQALDCHNVYRALHGASNLMWSPEIAKAAQHWAEKLARDRTLKNSTRERGVDGENLAMFTGNVDNASKEAIDMWYDEVKNYNFSRPGYQPRSGHFTQLVWKESKEFGVGHAQTSDGQLNIVVARYRPAGNVLRQYELNVFPEVSIF